MSLPQAPPAIPTGIAEVVKADPLALPELMADEPAFEEIETFDRALVSMPLLPPGEKVPPQCAAWQTRASAGRPAHCEEPDSARAAMDLALDQRKEDERDARLAGLEGCKGFAPGIVRAIRVEMAPRECGDVLSLSLLRKPPAGMTGPIFHALYGYAVAARAARMPTDAAKARELFAQLGAAAAVLPVSYGRAIALGALAGVDAGRAPEERERSALEAMEATRKVEAGDSAHVDAALDFLRIRHGWLAELATLALPALEGAPRRVPPKNPFAKRPIVIYGPGARARAATAVVRFIEDLPSFYAVQLLSDAELGSFEALGAFVSKGALPPKLRAMGDRAASPTADERALRAYGRLSLGIRLLDRRSIDRAAALLGGSSSSDRSPDASLMLALALSIHDLPDTAAGWCNEPRSDVFKPAALESLATGERTCALSLYDVGVLRDLVSARSIDPLEGPDLQREAFAACLVEANKATRSPLGWSPGALESFGPFWLLQEKRHARTALVARLERQAIAKPRKTRLSGWPEVAMESDGDRRFGSPAKNPRSWSTTGPAGVVRELQSASERFEPCYAALNSEASDRLALSFIIGRDGSVATVSATESDPNEPAFTKCMERKLAAFAFTAPDGGIIRVVARFQ